MKKLFFGLLIITLIFTMACHKSMQGEYIGYRITYTDGTLSYLEQDVSKIKLEIGDNKGVFVYGLDEINFTYDEKYFILEETSSIDTKIPYEWSNNSIMITTKNAQIYFKKK